MSAGTSAAADSLAADRVARGYCEDTGRPNFAGYQWGQPYTCSCGSVSSFPCNCATRSLPGTGTAA